MGKEVPDVDKRWKEESARGGRVMLQQASMDQLVTGDIAIRCSLLPVRLRTLASDVKRIAHVADVTGKVAPDVASHSCLAFPLNMPGSPLLLHRHLGGIPGIEIETDAYRHRRNARLEAEPRSRSWIARQFAPRLIAQSRKKRGSSSSSRICMCSLVKLVIVCVSWPGWVLDAGR